MPHDPLIYRHFTHADIPAAHRLSVAVGWPHRLEDWSFVAQAGSGFVAIDGDAVVGTILNWKFGSASASLGMVIVAPDHQGLGIGRQLMLLVLDELGPRTTFLHATREGQPLYEKLGFAAMQNATDQHQGTAFRAPVMPLPPGERLRPIGASDTLRLVELASRASGLDRSMLLPTLLASADGIALDLDGELLGFALFRRFGRGYAIGPVVVMDSPGGVRARALISYWLALNEGTFVRIDVGTEHGLTGWLEGLGLAKVDTVTRMVRKGPAPTPVDPALRQIAIINQALQ
ncbi:N-acetyltransferase GCN5 [Caballeronia sordidicola]|uniref:N-acetyltransferase GCN5 n=1 Tax=Caballeronia sordidicola TaxID=196367 RepID=A0A158HNM7_CABSO|nr:GNAT family N-acetyltransferase [Caballeronia sordidicola]SAL46012.1 N-acetyltransferase GCN5 [Caballeronia sordidicola]